MVMYSPSHVGFTDASSALRRARKDAGLSLRELGARAGTSHATLIDYEQGRKVPSVATFLRVIDACGFAPDLRLTPRVRVAGGLARGDELAAVLRLAEQFPSNVARNLDYPILSSFK